MIKIPNLTKLRANKTGYDTRYTIDKNHPLYNDPLVDPRESEFGFKDASSYYSKPNSMTGKKLSGLPDAPLVRLDIAKRLVLAEKYLNTDQEVRKILGAPAHIRIDDALRPYQVQVFAYEVAWPTIIKKMNPRLTDKEVAEQVPNYCAKPQQFLTPTPHLTGGAVDVALINMTTGEPFNRGHISGTVTGTAYPDYYEVYQLINGNSDINYLSNESDIKTNTEAIQSRRVLYYAMTKVAGLFVNPQEIWHYGKGDPLSEYVSGSNHPYYGIAKLPQWYLDELSKI
jgi:D-alanyl-D-alanine dipeptidase